MNVAYEFAENVHFDQLLILWAFYIFSNVVHADLDPAGYSKEKIMTKWCIDRTIWQEICKICNSCLMVLVNIQEGSIWSIYVY